MKKTKKTFWKKLQKFALPISIIGLCCQIAGVLSPAGSLQQKIIFLFGTSLLGIGALLVYQHMFVAMQIVAFLGVIIGFFTQIPEIRVYSYIGGISIIAILYIFKTGYHKKDRFFILGIVSLLFLALAFATNPISYPYLFNIFLLAGGGLMIAYSALEVFILKQKIAIIFLVLNIFFVIKPILILLK